MYLNKAIIYGNLTRDPELKSLPNGTQVVEFGLATNRTYKDKDGNKKEEVEFHNIVSFGRQAEVIAQYLKKGRGIFVEGRIRNRSWEKDGVKHYRTEIIVESFQFGPNAGGGDGGSTPRESAREDTSIPVANGPMDYPEEDINPDDIPF